MDAHVNENDWNSLTKEQKDAISKIIGSHFKDTKVTPSTNVKKAEDAIKEHTMEFSLSNPFCKAACGVAEAGAVAACSALSGGTAIAVCVAAAHAAGDYCRSRC